MALTPPVQPGIAPSGVPVPALEPPVKRQKTALTTSMPMLPQPSYQVPVAQQPQPVNAPPGQPGLQQQPLHQPAPTHSAMPAQPPTVRAGYVYSQPPPAARTALGPNTAKPGAAGDNAFPGLAFSNGQVITPKHTGPKPQEDHTLINCFSIEQIELHIASLNKGLQLSPQKLKTKCLDVLKVLQGHQHGWVFNSPVDPVELGLPDYFEVIKKPMDLGSIRKKLENGCYHSLEEFEGNVHVTFDNAMVYNPEGSVVYNMAKEMKEKFFADYEILIKELNAEEDAKRKNGEACLLCGCEKLLFEPPVFYCNGLNCQSKRIRRNSYYYVGGNNQYHWCHQCFQELREGKTIELGDISIQKGQLVKKKNDEVHEESWVQCDRCERWIHQICALFNTRQNKDQRSEYACPRCTIDERRKQGNSEGSSSTPMAADLQRTKLSEYLERHVRNTMGEHLETTSKIKSAKDVSVPSVFNSF
jgi:E1A/CREB-binding protein